MTYITQAERARKLAENERGENNDRVHELAQQVQSLQNSKRKVEGDLNAVREEIEDLENEARAAEERATKALAEVCYFNKEDFREGNNFLKIFLSSSKEWAGNGLLIIELNLKWAWI